MNELKKAFTSKACDKSKDSSDLISLMTSRRASDQESHTYETIYEGHKSSALYSHNARTEQGSSDEEEDEDECVDMNGEQASEGEQEVNDTMPISDHERMDHKPMSEDDQGLDQGAGCPYYCYLMVNYDGSQKINTHIGKSRLPHQKVAEWNEKSKGSRGNKKDPVQWTLSMVLGPFQTKEEAHEMKNLWRSKSRGIPSRRSRGIVLAQEYKLVCWDEAVKLNDTKGSI